MIFGLYKLSNFLLLCIFSQALSIQGEIPLAPSAVVPEPGDLLQMAGGRVGSGPPHSAAPWVSSGEHSVPSTRVAMVTQSASQWQVPRPGSGCLVQRAREAIYKSVGCPRSCSALLSATPEATAFLSLFTFLLCLG